MDVLLELNMHFVQANETNKLNNIARSIICNVTLTTRLQSNVHSLQLAVG